MSWISVDPGLDGTGVAVWRDFNKNDFQKPVHVLSFKFKTKALYMEVLDRLIKKQQVMFCYCENASYFQGDATGQVCATSGKLIKLAQFIGSLEEVCRRNNVICKLIPTMEWKGQVPKHVTQRKILEMWPQCTAKTSHAFDAVALGYWRLGKF